MEASIFRIPVLNAVFRGMKAIPVAPQKEEPEVVRACLRGGGAGAARRAAGVHLSRKGGSRRTARSASFAPGMLRILKDTPVPVIPLALSNLWGSMFSRFAKAPWKRLPRRYLARIKLAVGDPVPPEDVQRSKGCASGCSRCAWSPERSRRCKPGKSSARHGESAGSCYRRLRASFAIVPARRARRLFASSANAAAAEQIHDGEQDHRARGTTRRAPRGSGRLN